MKKRNEENEELNNYNIFIIIKKSWRIKKNDYEMCDDDDDKEWYCDDKQNDENCHFCANFFANFYVLTNCLLVFVLLCKIIL